MPRTATKTGAATGTGLVASSSTAGIVRLASPMAKPARRLLALEHERRREDRVGEQDHDDHAQRADRRGDRLVHDEPQAEPEAGEDQERVDQEEADAARHRADARDHRHATDGTARSCDRVADPWAAPGRRVEWVLTPWRDLPNVR